jgi:hypothetical protein
MGEQREKQLARDVGRLEAERDRERRRADAAEELVVVLQAEKQALQLLGILPLTIAAK